MITPESIVARDSSEYAHQVAFFCWAATSDIQDIELMFHVPNGELRDKVTAGRLKASGVKAGVPDVFWPVPNGAYHGLWIEFKKEGNHASKAQTYYRDQLIKLGYYVTIVNSWEEASRCVLQYNTVRLLFRWS